MRLQPIRPPRPVLGWAVSEGLVALVVLAALVALVALVASVA